MYQVWLVITVLSLVAGVGLLLSLVVLRGLSAQQRPPLEVVVGAFVAVGLAAFLGVYLRVLGVPRSALPYRVINSMSWGFAVFAALYFLSYWRGADRHADWVKAAVVAVGLGATAFLIVHAPTPENLSPHALQLQLAGILILELIVGVAALWVGVVSIKRAPELRSLPWRIAQKGTGIALLLLVPANLLEFTGSMVLRLQGHDAPDGFLFSFGYGVACVVLAVALIRALRLRHAGEPGAGTQVPDSMMQVLAITPRERDIIEKLLEGKSDREIAALLFISPRTVDTHLRNVFRKCAVSTRLQLSQKVAEYRAMVE